MEGVPFPAAVDGGRKQGGSDDDHAKGDAAHGSSSWLADFDNSTGKRFRDLQSACQRRFRVAQQCDPDILARSPLCVLCDGKHQVMRCVLAAQSLQYGGFCQPSIVQRGCNDASVGIEQQGGDNSS